MRMDTSHYALDMNCAGIASTVTLDEQESATCSSINAALFKLRERSRRDRVPFPQSDSGVAIHFHIGTNDGSRPRSRHTRASRAVTQTHFDNERT